MVQVIRVPTDVDPRMLWTPEYYPSYLVGDDAQAKRKRENRLERRAAAKSNRSNKEQIDVPQATK